MLSFLFPDRVKGKAGKDARAEFAPVQSQSKLFKLIEKYRGMSLEEAPFELDLKAKDECRRLWALKKDQHESPFGRKFVLSEKQERRIEEVLEQRQTIEEKHKDSLDKLNLQLRNKSNEEHSRKKEDYFNRKKKEKN